MNLSVIGFLLWVVKTLDELIYQFSKLGKKSIELAMLTSVTSRHCQ